MAVLHQRKTSAKITARLPNEIYARLMKVPGKSEGGRITALLTIALDLYESQQQPIDNPINGNFPVSPNNTINY